MGSYVSMGDMANFYLNQLSQSNPPFEGSNEQMAAIILAKARAWAKENVKNTTYEEVIQILQESGVSESEIKRMVGNKGEKYE